MAYDLGNDLTVEANVSYDECFDTRVSTDFKYRLRFDGKGKNNTQSNVIKALSKSLNNRDVRVHNDIRDWHCDPSVNAFNAIFDRYCRRKAGLNF